jgi:hypothetical protein
MPADRRTRPPSECPACGHDRPRRRLAIPRALSVLEVSLKEAWLCGLCGFEWAAPSRRGVIPNSPHG